MSKYKDTIYRVVEPLYWQAEEILKCCYVRGAEVSKQPERMRELLQVQGGSLNSSNDHISLSVIISLVLSGLCPSSWLLQLHDKEWVRVSASSCHHHQPSSLSLQESQHLRRSFRG